MKHADLKELVFLDHDGELPAAEREEARKHLASCAECRAELGAWKKTSTALFQARRPGQADGFVRDVMRRVGAEPLPAANPLAALAERFREAVLPRRLLLGGLAAAAAAVIWIAGPTLRRPAQENGAVEYAAAVMDESTTAEFDEAEIGTSIEKYFL